MPLECVNMCRSARSLPFSFFFLLFFFYKDEDDQYAPGINVIYNENTYNNEDLFQQWIKQDLSTIKSATKDFPLVMDAASFHITEAVESKQQLITPALVPAGCTGLLQPLDIAINKPFKAWLREGMILYELGAEEKGKTEWSASDRRIMTTWIVARAFERFKKKKNTKR